MVTPIEDQLRGQLRELKDSHNQLWYQLVEEQKENENLEARLKLLSDFTEDFYTANKSFNYGRKSCN